MNEEYESLKWEELNSIDQDTKAQAAYELAAQYLDQGMYVEAEELSLQAINIFKDIESFDTTERSHVFLIYAISLNEQNKPKKALNVLNDLVQFFSQNHYTLFHEIMVIKAHIEFELGFFNDALKTYEHLALYLDINNEVANLNKVYICAAEICLKNNQSKEAKDYLEKYRTGRQSNIDLENELYFYKYEGQIYLKSKQTTHAKNKFLKALRLAIRLDNNFETSYIEYLVASCYLELKDSKNAIKFAQSARKHLLTSDNVNWNGLDEINYLIEKIKAI